MGGQARAIVPGMRHIAYQDPNRPKFVENRSSVQCSLCTYVHRYPGNLVEGRCVAVKSCAARVKQGELLDRLASREN